MSTSDPWNGRKVSADRTKGAPCSWIAVFALLGVFSLTVLPNVAGHPRTDAFEGPSNSPPVAAFQTDLTPQQPNKQTQTTATGRATVRRGIRPYRVHHHRSGVVRSGRNIVGYTLTEPYSAAAAGTPRRQHRSKSIDRGSPGKPLIYENMQTGTIMLPPGSRAFLEPDQNRTLPLNTRQEAAIHRNRLATAARKRGSARPQHQGHLQPHHNHGAKGTSGHGKRHGTQQKFTVIDGLCIKCPPERTAIARKGLDGVLIEPPFLVTCRDRPISKDLYELETLFGPKLNFVLPHSNGEPYSFLAKVISKHTGNTVQTCDLRYKVIVKQCRRYKPKNRDLKVICSLGNIWGSRCTFHCRNGGYLSRPNSFVECSEDEVWEGDEPYCTFNDVSDDYAADASQGETSSGTDCQLDIPPANGRFACDLKEAESGSAELSIPNGTACQVKCDEGHEIPDHLKPAAFFGCVEGQWNNTMRHFCYKSSTIVAGSGGNSQRRRGYG
ncbi:uncharacterized protein LOC131216482 isoform X1 [Anopheles bellator]|uniref:uncharacterized protein LOC131216482 isoform X1 n=1 Tax=Anopheles bellator TaxID=139047 RepID=UPI0026470D95|nr:uncharacterized protein LOC131216482 isoform X1 [Anopheles bellator]XP_058066970.1 uncharacterized protein LOC131216482 isoform X1 [Anopheles bellator]XP_058066971.1 uncharacterized protein LOC131216482 isoform X1 [Anopheles bellator]